MIQVAIIGNGNISKKHILGYLAYPDKCRIVALVDIYPDKAEAVKVQHSLEADVYDDYRKILNRDDIDLVDICTPPYSHAQITIDSFDAGINVLVEKPMASSLQECDAMLEAARRNNKMLSVVAQNRFRPAIMNLKKTLDSGLAGDIIHVQVNSFWWRGHCYYDLWWRGTWEKEGGGCTLNHAVHHIDMLIWMMGMPSEVIATMGNTSHDNAEVEDLSMAMVKFKNGALGQITSSVVHHGEDQEIIFQGKQARISAPWKVYSNVSKSNGFPGRDKNHEMKIQDFYNQLTQELFDNPHQAQINDVLSALEQGKDAMISGEDGKKTLELITAIYKSSSTNTPVMLPLSKDDMFYTADGIKANAIHFYEKTGHAINLEGEDISVGSDYKTV